MFVTNEFWIPIAKSMKKAVNFPLNDSMPDWVPKTPTLTKTIISKVIGIICENSAFLGIQILLKN